MDLADIKALIETMAASDLREMEFSENGWTLRLVRDGARGPNEAAMRTETRRPLPRSEPISREVPDETALLAPLSGVVHLQASPREPPFVRVGQTVRAGDTLCLIEAMKVFNAIRTERDGTVAAVLVTAGNEVDAGQMLMRIVSGCAA
jgi:acetyl-CoA carboxylase biotin carboxyl carrier protein